MEAPSEKCRKCNWWLLLGEIRDELEMRLMDNKLQSFSVRKSAGKTIRELVIGNILIMFSRSAHKLCKEHYDGKR